MWNARLEQAGWHVLRYWEHEDVKDIVAGIRQTVLALLSQS